MSQLRNSSRLVSHSAVHLRATVAFRVRDVADAEREVQATASPTTARRGRALSRPRALSRRQ